jgi:hypothetical protein
MDFDLLKGQNNSGLFILIHVYALLSCPINILVSLIYICGGISRLSGAGLFLNTRPAKSNVDPWHGQKKPPGQSFGRDWFAPG